MYEFNYHRPASLDDAGQLIDADESAKLLAGGMTLLPTMKLRLAMPTDIVDLAGIGELKGICEDDDAIHIGAMTTHADVAASDKLRAALPSVADLAGNIGDAQVRNRGTIGGSLANNDPAADYPAAVLALNGTVVTDRREISADDFFQGMFETALEPGEIITAVRFPRVSKAAYVKYANPASRYAIVGVFVAKHDDGVRVAVTGAAAAVFRHADMEAKLSADFSAAAIDGVVTDADELNDDIHASATYRAHLVGVMAKRAVAAAGG